MPSSRTSRRCLRPASSTSPTPRRSRRRSRRWTSAPWRSSPAATVPTSPTVYFNVPAGYAALLPHLESDAALAQRFFARLRFLFYAGAMLPQDLWLRLEAAAVRATGERIALTSSWGTTETAPLATASHFVADRSGMIGVPAPGVEVKLMPREGKLEARVRGPNVMPGYWKRPDLSAAAFDEEGFYR